MKMRGMNLIIIIVKSCVALICSLFELTMWMFSAVCDKGYYGSSGSCTVCAVGTYSSSTGATSCTDCTTGTTTSSTGSTASSDCSKY